MSKLARIEDKVLETDQALEAFLATVKRPLVFTNGCFDLLHRGHVAYLQQAAALGASLLVAINTDASVRQLDKGVERPLNPLADRMAVLAALASVDAVCAFSDPTPLALIKRCQPDHLVKGGDWAESDIVGAQEVRQRGGQVHSIEFEFQRSTSSLVDKIRATDNSS